MMDGVRAVCGHLGLEVGCATLNKFRQHSCHVDDVEFDDVAQLLVVVKGTQLTYLSPLRAVLDRRDIDQFPLNKLRDAEFSTGRNYDNLLEDAGVEVS